MTSPIGSSHNSGLMGMLHVPRATWREERGLEMVQSTTLLVLWGCDSDGLLTNISRSIKSSMKILV